MNFICKVTNQFLKQFTFSSRFYQSNLVTATQNHCIYCFDSLIASLKKEPLPNFPVNLENFVAPLFVTWNKNHHQLRGCIGTFSFQPIDKVLQQYALFSALDDKRFNPIQLDELEQLSVTVSFLVNFSKRDTLHDWKIGKHGIILEFEDGRSATFLPEVVQEQNWDKDTTLKNLAIKGGQLKLFTSITDILKTAKLSRYESVKQSLTYKEYQQIKLDQSKDQQQQQ
eukprot:TRINITY_DN6952_c0_g1_i1.p1 TRINITY_DN6952_c0_g1~~TRINITY_DN6952_c0_g1_i1.p1  ORF type:complete len:226 (+),score=38.01 TRINITY_DN6952_c0_g1_i1:212-889(+)